MMSGIGNVLNSKVLGTMSLMRNHSTGSTSPQGLLKSKTSVRDSTHSDESIKGIKTGLQRRKTVLLNDGLVNKKDSEVDWRDRLK